MRAEAARGTAEPRDLLRWSILVLLVGGPLAFGAVHEPASIPLLSVAYATGFLSWARGHWARAHGSDVPHIPAARLLIGFHAVVACQLIPLPSHLLRLMSPGSFAFRNARSLVPFEGVAPISVSPPDTLRGLLFLGGMSLIYATVFREFDEPRWTRRLILTVVLTGVVITVQALIQAASAEPTKIYGVWKPRLDFAVFGPYVNRNHFSGFLALATPLALALTARAAQDLARELRHRPRGFLALGEGPGQRFLVFASVSLTLVVGLLAARSRGGFVSALIGVAAVAFAFRRRWLAGAVVVLVAIAGSRFVDFDPLVQSFASRGIRTSRLLLWADVARLVPGFPWLGTGFNAFATVYPGIQTFYREYWWGEAHNEYLQVLVETGIVGTALAIPVFWRLITGAVRAARVGEYGIGLMGSILASAVCNLVDFNWQIPANAAVFVALAGLAIRLAHDQAGQPRSPSRETGAKRTGHVS